MSKGRYFCGGSALAVTLALTLGAPAAGWAQGPIVLTPQAAQPPADDDTKKDDSTTVDAVISTGTFIRGAAEDAAIPVEVIGRDELLQSGSPNIEEIARSLTEVGNVQSQSARGANADGYGVSTINLRNLGSGRTLLTLNGRRLADEPVGSGGALNVTGGANQNANSIPMGALQQVEVLKGGGGAVYGSDAVAGVVNFVTRRDLNGIEVNADYTYVPDTSGNYHANVLWGRKANGNNVLMSFEYTHSAALAANDRDFTHTNFYNVLPGGNGGPIEALLGAYQFVPNVTFNATCAANGSSGVVTIDGQAILQAAPTSLTVGGCATPIALPADVQARLRYVGASNPASFSAIGGTGLMRDDGCLAIGGLNIFSTTPSPVCGIPLYKVENINDQTERYNIFADANFNVTDTLRFHSEASFSKTTNIVNGLSFTVNGPCDPWPAAAPPQTAVTTTARNCTLANVAGVGASYSVPGFNPAVFDYVTHAYNTSPNVRLFSDQQIADLTGRNPTTNALNPGLSFANGGVVGQGYVPVGVGRVTMPITTWKPFLAMRNPAFKDPGGEFRNESVSFRTTQELKGDLGTIWHNDIDFSIAATYQRDWSSRQGQTLLIDRLQRGLNGFATNLDDLGADGGGCTAAETTGNRTIFVGAAAPVTVTGIPYTVGAGGGADYDKTVAGNQKAPNGFDPGSAKGNGCYFFNPFSSGVYKSRINGATPVQTATEIGFVGGPAVGGTATDYQGYATGYGLANAPGIVKWMYAYRDSRSMNDNFYLDVVFNGTMDKWELPGGNIGWAAGGQYRYVHRQALVDPLGDQEINPCPFLSHETEGLTQNNNIVNATSTCTTTSGPFQIGVVNFTGKGFRETVNRAAFAEISLPLLKKLGTTFAVRYEQARIPNSPDPIGATVFQGSAKYQLTPSFALRASYGETFDSPTIEGPGQDFLQQSASAASLITGVPVASAAPITQRLIINNQDIDAETGYHYEVGVIYQSPGRNVQANMNYFFNQVEGQSTALSATAIARALVGLRSATAVLNADLAVDCSDPTVQALFDPTKSPSTLGGRAVVEIAKPDGSYIQGCQPNLTLAGINIDGDPNNDGLLNNDPGDYGLSIQVPSRVNAGAIKVAGIESNVTWRVPATIYDGVLILNTDLTVNLYRQNAAVTVFGTTITDSSDDTGILTAGFAAQVNIWRGGISATYLKGKSSFTLRANYVGPVASIAATPVAFGAAIVPGNNQSNLNPPNPALCGTNVTNSIVSNAPQPIRNGDLASIEPFFTGELPFNAACNYSLNEKSLKQNPFLQVGATWRYELPQMTTLSVSVENLLEADPPFFPATYAYNPFGSAAANGRTVKIGVTKKFPKN